MEWKGRGILAASIFVAVMAVRADSRNETEFDSIVQRNAFDLKAAPVAPAPIYTNVPVAVTNKEDFYLTGISTIGSPKRPKAYLVAKDSQKKNFEQKYYNLSVGDRQGDVTLKEVDERGRRVRIEYQGEDKWLSMKENGVPAATGPMGGGGLAGGAPGGSVQGTGAAPVPLPTTVTNSTPSIPSPPPLSYPNSMNRRFARGLLPPNSGVNSPGYAGDATAEVPELERSAPIAPTITSGVTVANPDVTPAQIPGSAQQNSHANGVDVGSANLVVPTPPVPQQ